ncbi:lipopolysaccharide assembly protein LapB [uncultured Bacteroides sp.]|uniref:tetratricopeptide repeat protein n=1 Tax=uncultured Bacteroides sp. TaxID=162156 RepID=UPI0025DECC8B|nr:hypothetical protein [uncultured Bacteroides sp.]
MKAIKFLLAIVLLSAVYSCDNKPYPRLMQVADSLVDIRPDSALSLLMQLKGSIDKEPEATQMYHKILTIRAKENTRTFFTSDSLVIPLLEYYKNDKERLPEIYYYAGMIYYTMGDSPQAQSYLRKALNAFKGSTNYRILYKIYHFLGMICHLNHATHANSIPLFKQANHYAELSTDSTLIAYGLLFIARGYQGENTDSMSYYYRKASDMAQQINNKGLYNDINTECGMCHFQEKNYQKAYDAFHVVHWDSLKHLPTYYFTRTYLFYETAKWDSAQYYCRQMLSTNNWYHNKDAYYKDQKNGYKMMSQIADKQGKTKEALEYLNTSLLYVDSLLPALVMTMNSQNSWLHNYHAREEENQRLGSVILEQKNRIVILSAGIICIFILVLSACIVYALKRKLLIERQKEKLRKIAEEQYRNSQEFITVNEKRIATIKGQLKNIEGQKDEMEKRLQESEKELLELINKQVETKQKVQTLSEEAFRTSQVYKDFCHVAGMPHSESISDKKKLTLDDWKELSKALDQTYNNFTERLIEFYPNISTHEIRICMLLKMRIPPISIADLTARSKQAINSSRKKLYERTHSQTGTPDLWDKFIQKF